MIARPFRNQPNHQIPYNNNPNRLQICSNCKKYHPESQPCRTLCPYCHDLHLQSDLIDNLCPVMYPLAKKQQEKHSYACRNCHGEGSYLEQVTTIRYQSKKKFEQKQKQWKEHRKEHPQNSSPAPERKVIFRDVQKKEVICQECGGKGMILRMLECCSAGCRRCRGDKYMINPMWKKYRKEPIINQEQFQCSICLQEVQISSPKYVLQCRHEFHPECIFKWIKDSNKCPVCRQHDLYLESEQQSVPNPNNIYFQNQLNMPPPYPNYMPPRNHAYPNNIFGLHRNYDDEDSF